MKLKVVSYNKLKELHILWEIQHHSTAVWAFIVKLSTKQHLNIN